MARLEPLTRQQKLTQNRQRREGVKISKGSPRDLAAQVWYEKQLNEYIDEMGADVMRTLGSQLRRLEPEYTGFDSAEELATMDSYVDELTKTLEGLLDRWSIDLAAAGSLANSFVTRSDKLTTGKLNRMIGDAMGVDMVHLVNSEGLNNVLTAAVDTNVALIKSIPEQYLGQVSEIVLNNSVKGRSALSMMEEIQTKFGATKSRAHLIARDQSNKINGDISRERQAASGIRAFRWRSVGDGAVRSSHEHRNGKFYAWSPADVGKRMADGTKLLDPNASGIGYPGEPIQCRCIAEPVIELDQPIQSRAGSVPKPVRSLGQ